MWKDRSDLTEFQTNGNQNIAKVLFQERDRFITPFPQQVSREVMDDNNTSCQITTIEHPVGQKILNSLNEIKRANIKFPQLSEV